ncbi:guanine nucleotide-binding protein alpha subunit [Suhomyces tanzawaensis NRRL Y-17324]|uniref:Guanine nucleotide-binding protein alpha subunit n=1 Tax=Suhomyces tanzawaensis NRRL Y-17324 TaxID=984487 RepID=A0A1E4SM14_9ASCO|nr:guanine nucleotide-binding protein alpha subunit [Suhomyces tanzawaensis NRRL Y-17324]ODV80550.1 guanine nucleotide-binding protein alpha subunit [Suhomyces tanzawaensis NRRL Y-17324]
MGCTASVPSNEEDDPFLQDKHINDQIEQSLRMTKGNDRNEFKLFLLGTGESGKSTVLKQMKLLHKGGFTSQERVQYAQVIWCDLIQSMKILLVQSSRLGIALDSDTEGSPLAPFKQAVLNANALQLVNMGAAGSSDYLSDYVIKYGERNRAKSRLNETGAPDNAFLKEGSNEQDSTETVVNEELMEIYPMSEQKQIYTRHEVAEAVSKLWSLDSGIKKCFEKSHEFQLESSASYYFDNCMKFADPNYKCSDLDILKGRIKTSGITETDFMVNLFKFKILDAGGQRSERKKWIHCFENITAIMFVLAVSEYDQTLFEDERVNRMHESIVLFNALCNSKWFINTPFILFLNKIDIFEQKIARSPLKKYFPDYDGKPNDVEDALKFFETNFLKLNKTNKPIYVHRTCATDTKSMKFVLSAVTDLIVQRNLKNSGIL